MAHANGHRAAQQELETPPQGRLQACRRQGQRNTRRPRMWPENVARKSALARKFGGPKCGPKTWPENFKSVARKRGPKIFCSKTKLKIFGPRFRATKFSGHKTFGPRFRATFSGHGSGPFGKILREVDESLGLLLARHLLGLRSGGPYY